MQDLGRKKAYLTQKVNLSHFYDIFYLIIPEQRAAGENFWGLGCDLIDFGCKNQSFFTAKPKQNPQNFLGRLRRPKHPKPLRWFAGLPIHRIKCWPS